MKVIFINPIGVSNLLMTFIKNKIHLSFHVLYLQAVGEAEWPSQITIITDSKNI